MEPKGPKRASKDPQKPTQKERGKKTPSKDLKQKPVLASEREARLKGELCVDMVPNVEQPAPRAITETLQRHP